MNLIGERLIYSTPRRKLMYKSTIEFVEENLEKIELIAEHGNPEMRKIATAFLLLYYEKKGEKRKNGV